MLNRPFASSVTSPEKSPNVQPTCTCVMESVAMTATLLPPHVPRARRIPADIGEPDPPHDASAAVANASIANDATMRRPASLRERFLTTPWVDGSVRATPRTNEGVTRGVPSYFLAADFAPAAAAAFLAAAGGAGGFDPGVPPTCDAAATCSRTNSAENLLVVSGSVNTDCVLFCAL